MGGYIIAPNGDAQIQYYPLKLYYSLILANEFSLWLPFEFLGTSFLGSLQTGFLYPLNIVYLFLSVPIAYNLSLLLHFALGGFFAFIYIRELGVRSVCAFMAGIVFGFSGFLMAHLGHVSIQNAAIWLPFLLYCYERIRVTLSWKYCVWGGLAAGFQTFAGHFQICVYSYLVLGAFVFYYLWDFKAGKRMRFLLLTALPIFLGALIASPQLFATFELSRYASRIHGGYAFFTESSYPPHLLFMLVFPFLYGFGYGREIWGAMWTPTEYAGFVGAFPLVLAAMAVVWYRRINKHVRFWTLIACLSFLGALGKYNPLYAVMYYVPVYNLFRVPARHVLELGFAISVLFAFGLNRLLFESKFRKAAGIQVAKGLLLLFFAGCLLLWVVASFLETHLPLELLTYQGKKVLSETFSLNNPAFFIPFIFLLGYTIWLCLFSIWRSSTKIGVVALGLLLFAESFSFGFFHNWPMMRGDYMERELNSPLFSYLKARNLGYERIAYISSSIQPLFNVPLRISTLNGYDPLIMNNFHQLTGISTNGTSNQWDFLLRNNLILSSFNVRYLILQDSPIDGAELEKMKGETDQISVQPTKLHSTNGTT